MYYYIASKPCPYPDDRRCNTSQACIRADKWCNQKIDCMDGSDEECCKSTVIKYIYCMAQTFHKVKYSQIDNFLRIINFFLLNISSV